MLTQVRAAIDAFFPQAKNVDSNGPYDHLDYPWLDCTGVALGGREISLRIKFWAGGRFCCGSAACRFFWALFDTDWSRLRNHLRAEGVEPDGPIRFTVRVEYDGAAAFAVEASDPETEFKPLGKASWMEFETLEGQPTKSQEPIRSSDDSA